MEKSTNANHEILDLQKATSKKSDKRKALIEKAFTSMLTTTSRNHYAMNQMVDRKARIILIIDALIISLIISKIIVNHDMHDLKFVILVIAGIAALGSIIYAILAIAPEESHGKLSTEDLSFKKGNPLFFGNFKDLRLSEYIKAMMSMKTNIDLIHIAIIEDVFYLGKALEQKRVYLKYSIYILIGGIFSALIMALLFRMIYGDIPVTL